MIGIVIGHNEKKQGAHSIVGMEYNYCSKLAGVIKKKLGDEVQVFRRTEVGSYTNEMTNLVNDIHKAGEFSIIIELHFNGVSDQKVGGSEILVYEKSSAIPVAEKLLSNICRTFETKNRGLKKITNARDRGGYGIMKCKYPYILIEPFFGSNPIEAEKFKQRELLADVIINTLKEEHYV